MLLACSEDPDILRENCRKTVALLGCQESNSTHLVIDETVWAANFDLIAGLRPGLGLVGGHFSLNASSNKSFLPVSRDLDFKEVPQDLKASLTLNFVLTRGDSNAYSFDLCSLPRKSGCDGTAEHLLLLTGKLLHSFTLANGGRPIPSIAFDGGLFNQSLNRTLLGLSASWI